MKKKKIKSKPKKQKIDIVIESLVNLEQKVKELIQKVERLQYFQPYYPPNDTDKKYWPVDDQYPKYKDVTWYNK